MTISVNTSYSTDLARQQLGRITRSLTETESRLTTGLRVDDPRDDASTYAIANTQRARLEGLRAVIEAEQAAEATIDTAVSAAREVTDILNELKAKAVQAEALPAGDAGLNYLNDDVNALIEQIDTIVETASFNGTNLLTGVEGVGDGGGVGGQADIVFLFDVTTSMGPYITKVANAITGFAQSLTGQGVDAQYGVMYFSSGGPLKSIFSGGEFTSDPTELQTNVAGLPLYGSVETSLDALNSAVSNYTYRAGAAKHYVLITDDTLQTEAALTVNGVASTLQAANVTTHVIGTGLADSHTISDSTGGLNLNIADATYDSLLEAVATDVSTDAAAEGDNLAVLIGDDGATMKVAHRPLSTSALNLAGIDLTVSASDALVHIDQALTDALRRTAQLGADAKRLDVQQNYLTKLRDILAVGIGNLVDADMAEEAARLESQRVRQSLAVQALGLTQNPNLILSLFQPL